MLRARRFFCIALLGCCTTPLQATSLNSRAPSFTLPNFQNQTRTLESYRGEVVFINFWASWCAPCQVELPELNRLAADYAGRKVRVLAINVDRDRAAAKHVLAKLGLLRSHLEVLRDAKSKVVGTYNISEMPSSFILDQHGIIRYLHHGFRSSDPPAWRKEIDNLLQ